MNPRTRKAKYTVQRAPIADSVTGTLVIDPGALPPTIDIVAYGPEEVISKRIDNPQMLTSFVGRYPVLWVKVEGLGNGQVIYQIGQIFGLHQLALEDVVHVHQRAKVERYDHHTFIVARMIEIEDRLVSEQVSIFLGEKFVITFQERQSQDCLDVVRERVRHSVGRLRSAGPDYLVYSMLDAVIDAYFPVLEQYGDRLEDLETQVTQTYDRAMISRIHEIKTELMMIRRAIWPHREMVNTLMRDECPMIHDETRVYLRDCYDHTVQLIDLVETYRELGADLRDLYLSTISNRMNEIMKVLTVISTIFIPLSFIAGVYGMNFNTEISPWNMPELHWYLGYPFSLLLMAGTTAIMLVYFYRKGWLGGSKDPPPTGHSYTDGSCAK